MGKSRKSIRRRKRKVNWDKYTDFASRHTKDDLASLCAGYERKDLEHVFNRPDQTGLYPIHWAAIHNRSDLIEFLIDNGAHFRLKCRNKLFADGTALHLAAMNGCIEAAGMLLRKCESSRQNETKPKTLNTDRPPTTEENQQTKKDSNGVDWLLERDADGQTPLMRSAAPRSKRLDIVRDLLRKNLWSLSARPSEMALFLINKGGNWRETEPIYSMNLMHLAIVNDYDDIVNMLIVIDSQLLTVPAKLKQKEATQASTGRTSKQTAKPQAKEGEFVTIDLSTPSPSSASSSSSFASQTESDSTQPLVDRQEVARNLLSSGLSPLQLAIVYGRLTIVSLLWFATLQRNLSLELTDKRERSIKAREADKATLRATLLKIVWSNKDEFFSLIRGSLLKILLVVDLTVLTMIWMPAYLTSTNGRAINLRNGTFVVSYCVTLALAFKVIAKNPGFLTKNTEEYFQETSLLTGSHRVDSLKSNDTIEKRDLEQVNEKHSAPRPVEYNPLPTSTRKHRRAKPDLEERVRLLCHRCRTIRKPRSRHCNYCNHCVQDFDHHCIYLGCCVGRYNRLDFLIMLMAVSLTAIYGIVIQTSSLDRDQWQHGFWHFLALVWIGKYALVGTLNAFNMLRRASMGVTMYEDIRSNRLRKIFGPNGAPLEIMRSHKMYSTLKGSFWRYAPNRFMTGDLPQSAILKNLKEFSSLQSITDYFMFTFCADSSIARSMKYYNSKIDSYKDS